MSQKKTPTKDSAEPQADAPGVAPEKDEAAANGPPVDGKPVRTRVHRGQKCPITKTTRNTVTGAIYDHVLYTRNVTNRRNGTSAPATVGKKLRRPGTGTVDQPKEVEFEE